MSERGGEVGVLETPGGPGGDTLSGGNEGKARVFSAGITCLIQFLPCKKLV